VNETTKAMRRRRESPAAGFWWRVFQGKGIDVGSGSDPLDLNGWRKAATLGYAERVRRATR
jgi:hypothetical protein